MLELWILLFCFSPSLKCCFDCEVHNDAIVLILLPARRGKSGSEMKDTLIPIVDTIQKFWLEFGHIATPSCKGFGEM